MHCFLILRRKILRLSDERYEEIKEEVVNIYEELHITKFPIFAMDVCQGLGITLKSYNHFNERTFNSVIRASEDGIVLKIDNHYKIFYNLSKSRGRIRSTVFHEIGHIRLRYIVHDEENEAEANFFASYLLAPPPLINYFNLKYEEEIMEKFWTTHKLASFSLDRYYKWLHFSPNEFTEYEKKLIKLAKEGESNLGT